MIHLIDRFTEKLRRGRYNNATIKAYRDAVFLFYNNYRDTPQAQINENLISTYLKELKNKKSYPPEVIIQNGKAIKLFYKTIFDKDLDIKASGAKKNKTPYILSKQEIKNLLENTKNVKHELIISLAYGLGLKINEITSLKKSDIDFENSILNLAENEGELRQLNIPNAISEKLKNYISHKNSPSDYIFANKKGKTISSRGIQLYISRLISELNMDESISLQNLRHSYAVHLLNDGIDIHHLQKALGHKFLQNTAVYTNLSNFKIKDLKSPISDLI